MSKATIKTVNGSVITIEKATEDRELLKGLSVDQVFYDDLVDCDNQLLEIEKLYKNEINEKLVELLKEELDIYRKENEQLRKVIKYSLQHGVLTEFYLNKAHQVTSKELLGEEDDS